MNRGSEARPYRPTQPLIIGLFLPGQHSREIEGVARTGSRGHRDPEFTVEKTPTANDVVVVPQPGSLKLPLALPSMAPVASIVTSPTGILMLPHSPVKTIGAILTVFPDCVMLVDAGQVTRASNSGATSVALPA